MAFRLDFGRLDKFDRTPSGGLRIPAYVTRTGVFTYRTDDGRVIRELRHPDHVFSKDSLDSLEDAPLTIRHPGKVTPKDYKANVAGHVRDAKPVQDTYVEARAIVQDAGAISGVEKGDLVEVSCGYTCDVDPTPGEYRGEKYDSIQTNIRYNHVALGPKNWGRAGNSVSLRLDSGDAIQETVSNPHTNPPDKESPMLVTINGKPYTHGTPEHIAALEAFQAEETKRADAAEAAVKAADAKASEAQGRADAADKALKAAQDPKAQADAVQARINLQTSASKFLDKDFKFDGKTDTEIMVAAITKADPEFKADGLDVNYIRGRFAGLTPREDSVGSVRKAAKDAVKEDSDGKSKEKSLDQKRADENQARADAWKQPLTLSKQAK